MLNRFQKTLKVYALIDVRRKTKMRQASCKTLSVIFLLNVAQASAEKKGIFSTLRYRSSNFILLHIDACNCDQAFFFKPSCLILMVLVVDSNNQKSVVENWKLLRNSLEFTFRSKDVCVRPALAWQRGYIHQTFTSARKNSTYFSENSGHVMLHLAHK